MFSPPYNPFDLSLINSTDPSFELELNRRRAFFVHHDTKIPKDDLEELEHELNSSRASPEPDNTSFTSFQRRLRNSCNEAAVVQGVMPKLVPIDDLLDREDVITVPNQQWDKDCGLPVPYSAEYRISPPKPDQTIGLAASNFVALETTLAYLSHAARPIKALSNLTFPLVTVEAKGDRGHNVCRFQSLHNAAVMLHQLLRLWEDTGNEEDLFGRSMVCTISVTTQTCAISHYWLESTPDGIAVYGRLFKSWTLNLQEPTELGAITRCIHNTIDFTINRGKRMIMERLAALENKLPSTPSPSCSPSCRKRRLRRRHGSPDSVGTPSPDRYSSPRGRGSSRVSKRAFSSRSLGSRRSSGSSSHSSVV
ncbi:hypothetical protein EJ08DRAFT_419894 [Tothia fuscella]|uniref:DUF7924 domain-containing protein n=1 Tax=Tothia fuscella TaxID=1048955 RepID=A0A9P4NJD4_9PEZI|nr:hypothetical protein EJ08DRAFT_419894 [Tothia fuscella]